MILAKECIIHELTALQQPQFSFSRHLLQNGLLGLFNWLPSHESSAVAALQSTISSYLVELPQ